MYCLPYFLYHLGETHTPPSVTHMLLFSGCILLCFGKLPLWALVHDLKSVRSSVFCCSYSFYVRFKHCYSPVVGCFLYCIDT